MKAQGPRLVSIASGLAAVLLLIANPLAAGGLSGAIFTTTWDGSFVNANVYDDPSDVYLNGGPPPNKRCSAAGLPDGMYYFQVTDPSGATLLSVYDGVEARWIQVSGGIITSANHASLATASGLCGAITVPLWPYAQTPNPDGEYKVWITPMSDPFQGFLPSNSKTDNFKVVLPDGVVWPTPEADIPTD